MVLVASFALAFMGAATASAARAGIVGAEACRPCHAAEHREWSAGRHSRMVQPATPQSVRGDFRGAVTLRGLPYKLRRDGDAFFITERYLERAPRERRVELTLGNRRVQHYLTRLEDGRIVVLPPSWDVERGEWFHNLDIVDAEETTDRRVQVWNTNCFGCHVSQEEKRYDPARRTYDTRWQDFGTNCERCHGPGETHVAHRRAEQPLRTGEIVHPGALDATAQSMICAQCHSLRDMLTDRYAAGEDYFDHFMPILEYAQKPGPDPAWWADGRPRRFSNDALGFWLSACYRKGGATCLSCHSSGHRPDVDGPNAPSGGGNTPCLQCHEDLGRDLAAHTRHRPDGPGSSCVECHMPKEVVSLRRSAMRDHSVGIPAPENTERFGIPNACGSCHRDRSPRWAVDTLARWSAEDRGTKAGGNRRGPAARAEAFTGGRARRPESLPALVSISADPEEPFLFRANALGHLRGYDDPRAIRAARAGLRDAHPLVRAVAALNLGERRGDAESRADLANAAADPLRVVRVAAAFALVSSGSPGAATPRVDAVERAKREYVERAALLEDDPASQLDLGKFHLLDRRADEAVEALERVRGLDPRRAGLDYFLGLARLGQGRMHEGRRLLESLKPGDPFHRPARDVLDRLPPPR